MKIYFFFGMGVCTGVASSGVKALVDFWVLVERTPRRWVRMCPFWVSSDVGGGALWEIMLSGLGIIVVWATVDIGVAKWTRCWLHGLLDGSYILDLSIIGTNG